MISKLYVLKLTLCIAAFVRDGVDIVVNFNHAVGVIIDVGIGVVGALSFHHNTEYFFQSTYPSYHT